MEILENMKNPHMMRRGPWDTEPEVIDKLKSCKMYLPITFCTKISISFRIGQRSDHLSCTILFTQNDEKLPMDC